MSPLRWDVLGVGLVLALPVLAMRVRGDLSTEDVLSRLPWCLLAAWVAVTLLRTVVRPPPTPDQRAEPDTDAQPDRYTESAPVEHGAPESPPTA